MCRYPICQCRSWPSQTLLLRNPRSSATCVSSLSGTAGRGLITYSGGDASEGEEDGEGRAEFIVHLEESWSKVSGEEAVRMFEVEE